MGIKVLIADDHALVRQGIKRVLSFEEDIEVVGEAEDGQKALGMTLVLQPDVLLLDLNLSGTDGVEVSKQLQAARCKTRIIVLTIHDSDNYVLELLKNGVKGYLLKDVEPDMLVKAIRAVCDGGTYICPELEERVFGGIGVVEDINEKAAEMWREGRNDRITGREMEVLRCIAKGFNNQEIAQTLFVSEKTVKNHLTNIFRKINVTDRTQALIYVLKNNMVDLE